VQKTVNLGITPLERCHRAWSSRGEMFQRYDRVRAIAAERVLPGDPAFSIMDNFEVEFVVVQRQRNRRHGMKWWSWNASSGMNSGYGACSFPDLPNDN
jgi:hypothetical protein